MPPQWQGVVSLRPVGQGGGRRCRRRALTTCRSTHNISVDARSSTHRAERRKQTTTSWLRLFLCSYRETPSGKRRDEDPRTMAFSVHIVPACAVRRRRYRQPCCLISFHAKAVLLLLLCPPWKHDGSWTTLFFLSSSSAMRDGVATTTIRTKNTLTPCGAQQNEK